MASGDLYLGVQRGTVDATWQNPDTALTMFAGVARYFTIDWDCYVSGLANMVNLDKWKTIPPDLQKILQDSADDMIVEDHKTVVGAHKAAVEKLKEAGVQTYVLSPDEAKRWRDATIPVRQEYLKRAGPEGTKLLDIFTKYFK